MKKLSNARAEVTPVYIFKIDLTGVRNNIWTISFKVNCTYTPSFMPNHFNSTLFGQQLISPGYEPGGENDYDNTFGY